MLIGTLLAIAGLIYSVLGLLHLVFTLLDERNPRRLAPDDPAVVTAMQASKLRLSRGAISMWQAWISFNLTHSLAALMLGAACFIVATCFRIFAFPPLALFALAGVSGLVALIGQRYWFGAPRAGSLAATLCLLVAASLYAF
ncbi:MAG TPA: hypothetical protein VMF52_14645 [Steroidobacteraceae bacterium]|nr:hypothetical protein [Steroidobacteraceae bacterium]